MALREVTVIDYGVGNLLSVQRGLEHCGAKVSLSSDPRVILKSERVVLPGVGAFPRAMEALHRLKLVSVIQEFAQLDKPLLAICLGMQLLMDESEEFGLTEGLGIISGRVVPIPKISTEAMKQKIPHIGWNALNDANPVTGWDGTLLRTNKVGDYAYFVHSFMALPTNKEDQISEVIYGGHKISAVVSRRQTTGCQFHPEKSGEVGLRILRQFVTT
jgi:imidazole glycerol-phosphate synthase subunit HisH